MDDDAAIDRVVNLGIALFGWGGVSVAMTVIWWPLMVLAIAGSIYISGRFLDAVNALRGE